MSPGGGAACQRSTDHPKRWKGLGLRAYSVFAAAVEQPCREGPWWRGLGSLVAATCEGVSGGDLWGKEGVDGGGERRLECEGEERLQDLGEKARKIGVTGREAPSVRTLFFRVLGLLFSFALAPVRPPGAKKSFPVGARDSRSVVLTPSGTVKLSWPGQPSRREYCTPMGENLAGVVRRDYRL